MRSLVIVDMLKGFLQEGYPLYCGKEAEKIIPRVQKLLEKEKEAGSNLIFVCDNHDPEDLEFKIFPKHCVAGTEEAEIIPELLAYGGTVLPKKRYSGFYNTRLDEVLKQTGTRVLAVCGVCTDICVMHTVADARNRDYEVEVYTDCVASFDENKHKFALEHMEKILGAKLVTSESKKTSHAAKES